MGCLSLICIQGHQQSSAFAPKAKEDRARDKAEAAKSVRDRGDEIWREYNFDVSLQCVFHGIRFKVNEECGLSGDKPHSLYRDYPPRCSVSQDLGAPIIGRQQLLEHALAPRAGARSQDLGCKRK